MFYWSPGSLGRQQAKLRLRLQRSPFEEDEVLLLIALPTIFDDEPRHFQATQLRTAPARFKLPNQPVLSSASKASRCRGNEHNEQENLTFFKNNKFFIRLGSMRALYLVFCMCMNKKIKKYSETFKKYFLEKL